MCIMTNENISLWETLQNESQRLKMVWQLISVEDAERLRKTLFSNKWVFSGHARSVKIRRAQILNHRPKQTSELVKI